MLIIFVGTELYITFMQSITNKYQPKKTFIMKKRLLYLASIMLFSALSINAQTKVWDFSTDKTNWPLNYPGVTSATPATTIQKDLLNLTSHTSSTTYFGIVAASVTTFTADGFVSVDGIKTGGSGAATNFLPTVRYFSFNVSAACTVKVWFRHGSATVGNRSVFVTSGSASYGSGTATETGGATPNIIVNANVTAAGPVYIYSDNAVTIYKIEVTGATVNTPALATKNFQKELDVAIYAKSNKIFLSNIKSSTKVNVYNVLGALVKTAQVDADSSLDISSGVYIVNAKSVDGEKSVKVIVQ
jgi:hypothetical protein